MNDKLVVGQIKEHLQLFNEEIDSKFSNKRLLEEIDVLLTASTKGSDAHRKNIQFVMELKGLLKSSSSLKKNVQDTEYEEVPPFSQD